MGKKWKQWQIFSSWDPKITVDSDCSHEIKRSLLLGRKAMTNIDSMLQNRDIILPTKVHIVKAIVFPVVVYRCESWTIKKAERWRTAGFKLWYWRLLRVPWTARSNQSVLKEINPEYSLEGLMLKLKLQYFLPDVKSWLTGKDPDSGKDWGQEKRVTEDEMFEWHHRLNGHEFEQIQEIVEDQGACCVQSMRSQQVGHDLVTEQ